MTEFKNQKSNMTKTIIVHAKPTTRRREVKDRPEVVETIAEPIIRLCHEKPVIRKE